MGLLKEGRLRALAVSTAQRSRVTPDIPTIAESGLPDFRYDSWNAMYTPVKTPRAIVNRLNQEVVRILKLPEIEQRLLAIGMDATSARRRNSTNSPHGRSPRRWSWRRRRGSSRSERNDTRKGTLRTGGQMTKKDFAAAMKKPHA